MNPAVSISRVYPCLGVEFKHERTSRAISTSPAVALKGRDHVVFSPPYIKVKFPDNGSKEPFTRVSISIVISSEPVRSSPNTCNQ